MLLLGKVVEYIGGRVIRNRCCFYERCCFSGKVVEYIGGRVISERCCLLGKVLLLAKGPAFRKGGRVIRKAAAFSERWSSI